MHILFLCWVVFMSICGIVLFTFLILIIIEWIKMEKLTKDWDK